MEKSHSLKSVVLKCILWKGVKDLWPVVHSLSTLIPTNIQTIITELIVTQLETWGLHNIGKIVSLPYQAKKPLPKFHLNLRCILSNQDDCFRCMRWTLCIWKCYMWRCWAWWSYGSLISTRRRGLILNLYHPNKKISILLWELEDGQVAPHSRCYIQHIKTCRVWNLNLGSQHQQQVLLYFNSCNVEMGSFGIGCVCSYACERRFAHAHTSCDTAQNVAIKSLWPSKLPLFFIFWWVWDIVIGFLTQCLLAVGGTFVCRCCTCYVYVMDYVMEWLLHCKQM